MVQDSSRYFAEHCRYCKHFYQDEEVSYCERALHDQDCYWEKAEKRMLELECIEYQPDLGLEDDFFCCINIYPAEPCNNCRAFDDLRKCKYCEPVVFINDSPVVVQEGNVLLIKDGQVIGVLESQEQIERREQDV
ncbi:hypothetical protein [Anaerocellum danielii]|uniref:Uncharacterized protein n=1 Tax=Anaerocellum danielii TaxID=1387557 RepID=A0ABZ0TZB8_9FIRM|nr:hypothetical protein [Caldicellulosiruptor danielii]WPX08207.1 hypothetical protein SOJ16_002074 [Caldicellulosiruptor danielii]